MTKIKLYGGKTMSQWLAENIQRISGYEAKAIGDNLVECRNEILYVDDVQGADMALKGETQETAGSSLTEIAMYLTVSHGIAARIAHLSRDWYDTWDDEEVEWIKKESREPRELQ